MKKKSLLAFKYSERPTSLKLNRIMRMSALLLGSCVFCMYAENANSQNARVSRNESNIQLEKILDEIESQTDYLFVYNQEIDVNRKVSVKSKTEPVSEVLNNLFKNMGISYTMEGTHIVLRSNLNESLHSSTNQQLQSITGRVLDSMGEPIIGANVVVKGTTNGTVTDLDGNFTIEVAPKSILYVSYIG